MAKILWGLWSENDQEWNGDICNQSFEAFFDRERAKKAASDDWRPRPLAIEIDAYRALRDALAKMVGECRKCEGEGNLPVWTYEGRSCWISTSGSKPCPACAPARAALAVADAVLTTCGEEGKSPCER